MLINVTKYCVAAFVTGLAACLGFPALACGEQMIKVGGDGSFLGVMEILGKEFEMTNRTIKVQVLPSMGSRGGVRAVVHGALDIGVSGCPKKEGETGAGVEMVEIARSPVVFVTYRNNPKSDITTSEVEEIYSGRTRNWPDGTPISLVLRRERNSTTRVLKGVSPEMDRAVTSALTREGMLFALTDQENVKILMKMPGAFGTATLAQIIAENVPLKVLTYNGRSPSATAVGHGKYRLYKQLCLVIPTSGTSGPVREFLAFIRSPRGRSILLANGALPLAFSVRR